MEEKITPDTAAKRMGQIFFDYGHDPEIAHARADDLLIEILIQHGYAEAVKQYESITRWYA